MREEVSKKAGEDENTKKNIAAGKKGANMIHFHKISFADEKILAGYISLTLIQFSVCVVVDF